MIELKCDNCKEIKPLAYAGKKTLCSRCFRLWEHAQKHYQSYLATASKLRILKGLK